MATSGVSASPVTTPATTKEPSSSGGLDDQTILIIVAVAAGVLLLIVILLLIAFIYLYLRKDRIAQKKPPPVDNRHRLFREPTNFGSKFNDIVDLQDLEQASFFRESHRHSIRSSRRGSIRSARSSTRSTRSHRNSMRKNPTFGKDDLYGDAFELNKRQRKTEATEQPHEESQVDGSDNPAVDISDEVDPTTTTSEVPEDPSHPPPPISAKVNILNPATWKKSQPGERSQEDERSGEKSEGGVFTISGSKQRDEDEGIDLSHLDEMEEVDTYNMFSPFQRANSQRRRSFKSRNSAVIDFYEGGAFDNDPAIARKAAKGDTQDPFWDGFGPSSGTSSSGLLWQNKRIF